MNNIPKPSKKEVNKYLKKWNTLENYALQETALNKLFTKTYPKNNDLDEILIKCSSLNDFYSTNIFSIFSVAKHILELNIDERLKTKDINLVNDIAHITITDKDKVFYSFATKYCSHHNSEFFPIYDSYVEKCLMYFKKIDKFAKFKKDDLKDYNKFKDVLIEFKNHYDLNEYSLKEIDKYLWQLGRKYFPKKLKPKKKEK